MRSARALKRTEGRIGFTFRRQVQGPWHHGILQAFSWCAGSPDRPDCPERPTVPPNQQVSLNKFSTSWVRCKIKFCGTIQQILLQVTCTIKVGESKKQMWAPICPHGFLHLIFSFHLLAQLTYGLSISTNTKIRDRLLNHSSQNFIQYSHSINPLLFITLGDIAFLIETWLTQ